MTSYDKLWGRFYNEHTALASVHGLDRSRIVGSATDGEVVSEGQPIHSFTLSPAIFLSKDGYDEFYVWDRAGATGTAGTAMAVPVFAWEKII